MDFIHFLQDLFFKFPTDVDRFIANPYPVLLLVFLLFLILKRKFGFLFYFVIALTIFLIGLYFGIINPVTENLVSLLIFSVCSVIAIGLLIFKILLKNN